MIGTLQPYIILYNKLNLDAKVIINYFKYNYKVCLDAVIVIRTKLSIANL